MDKFISFEFFQLFDTFSLLSLGIIFVLIFLVIFHFKSRIQSLEAKNDHLCNCCHKIAYEMEELKNASFHTMQDNFLQDTLHNSFQGTFLPDKLFKKLNVFECVLSDEVESVSITDDVDDHIEITEDVFKEPQLIESNEEQSLKEEVEEALKEEVEEALKEEVEEALKEEVEEALKEEVTEQERKEKEPNEDFNLEDLSVITVDKNEYTAMTVQMLRTMAVAKGIVVDVSKMKKKEIVKLLDGV